MIKNKAMDFVITLLENQKRCIEKKVKSNDLMQKDRRVASQELSKVREIKRAIKILKSKKKKYEHT